MTVRQRCAIYTRKSSEEGLEQNFNSLHAQREACEAYVLSQAGEGWSPCKSSYDDGGVSGGSMDRPGLQALMRDVDQGLIDIVVVYKVDRLTRSLADFAKIVEKFDARNVSFVSVTQAFNTTTSMGRLTLNVLLSFAQFEREVTAERIRDKVSASKAKGLWMGGRVPLGYDVVDHRLSPNLHEAEVVRKIFRTYLELGTVQLLEEHLRRSGVRSKEWTSTKGQSLGGRPFSRGALYYLLSNPAYRGGIRHKDKVYEDAHPVLIDEMLWEAVQTQLQSNRLKRSTAPSAGKMAAFLEQLIFDDLGHPMVASHTQKKGVRYRYYVSLPVQQGRRSVAGSVPRIPMATLDRAVISEIEPIISNGWRPEEPLQVRIRSAVRRIVVSERSLAVDLVRSALRSPETAQSGWGDVVSLTFPMQIRRRQGAVHLLSSSGLPAPIGKPDRALVRAVALSRQWARQLEDGVVESVKALAKKNGLCEHYTARLLPLAYLAPDLTVAILAGQQPASLCLKTLVADRLPLDWRAQAERLGGAVAFADRAQQPC